FDEALLAALAERDRAGSRREDRVVAADAGSRTGTELRSALADDDHPGLHVLAGEDLHADHLRIGVAPVARRADPFLVGHLVPPHRRADPRLPPIAALRPPLAGPHLLPAHVADHARRHGGARRELALAVPAHEEDSRLERLPLLRADPVHDEPFALADDVLLAADGDDRVALGLRGHSRENAGVGPRAGPV